MAHFVNKHNSELPICMFLYFKMVVVITWWGRYVFFYADPRGYVVKFSGRVVTWGLYIFQKPPVVHGCWARWSAFRACGRCRVGRCREFVGVVCCTCGQLNSPYDIVMFFIISYHISTQRVFCSVLLCSVLFCFVELNGKHSWNHIHMIHIIWNAKFPNITFAYINILCLKRNGWS